MFSQSNDNDLCFSVCTGSARRSYYIKNEALSLKNKQEVVINHFLAKPLSMKCPTPGNLLPKLMMMIGTNTVGI